MQLNDYLKDGNIFDEIAGVNPYPFVVNPVSMQNILRLHYGKRVLFSELDSFTKQEVAGMIVEVYGERWERLVQRQLVLDNANDRREVTESIERSEDTTSEANSTDKVASWDTEVLSDESGRNTTGNEGVTGSTTRTYIDEKVDVRKSFDLLNVKSRDTIINLVVKDVADFLTLSIY